MDSILNDDSTDIFSDDKMVLFISATSNVDKDAHQLLYWKGNFERFPHIGREVRRYLAVQAFSVACETIFSVAGTLIQVE